MKTVLFALLDKWADWEAAYLSSALQMLGQNQFSNRVLSLTKDPVESIGGFRVVPDCDLQSVPADYDALILIGGMSWRDTSAQQLKSLIESCLIDGKVLGAICDASAYLGTIGVLNSVRHTSNDLNDLKAWAGDAYTGEDNYVREQAVRDCNVITANGTAALEFAQEVLLALKVAPEEAIHEWYQFHKLGYYSAPLPGDATSWNEE
ncbi:MAG: DJ-1/PfpI family protein [Massilioclostridium sp.]|nr:DJ-1/PfpI family protein [Massilioclostridium sp.]MEE1490423.1 DJ-1/PfpI family protein [Massilioclostridium sp.]